MKPITESTLRAIAPGAPADVAKYADPLTRAMYAAQINTPRRAAMFLAQVAHESDAFKAVAEYASGSAYEGRADLGNTVKGDGVRYKGRGLIQITGRKNYAAASKNIYGAERTLLDKPEMLELPEAAARSAVYFWGNIKGNALADLPDTWRSKTLNYSPFQYITYRINGGQNGIKSRQEYYARAQKALAPLFA